MTSALRALILVVSLVAAIIFIALAIHNRNKNSRLTVIGIVSACVFSFIGIYIALTPISTSPAEAPPSSTQTLDPIPTSVATSKPTDTPDSLPEVKLAEENGIIYNDDGTIDVTCNISVTDAYISRYESVQVSLGYNAHDTQYVLKHFPVTSGKETAFDHTFNFDPLQYNIAPGQYRFVISLEYSYRGGWVSAQSSDYFDITIP